MPVTLPDVVRELSSMSPERVAEVYDFVLFLKTRAVQGIDESDVWSEEDQQDASRASRAYAEALLAAEGSQDD